MIDIGYSDSDSYYLNMRINCAGHIFANYGREINRPSGRDNYLLFYVASGSETFLLNGKREKANAGSFIVFAPGEAQQHVCEHTETAEFFYVHFECDSDTLKAVFDKKTSTIYRCSSGKTLSDRFQEIINELQLQQSHFHEIAVTKLYQLFLYIKRSTEKDDRPSSKQHTGLVHKIIHEINITWKENLTLEEYANRFGLSKYHFLRIFKQHTGLSPIAYRNRLRLRYAEKLLEETDMPIALIAESTGFESQQYFCDAFKDRVGMSPSNYRKKR